MKIRKGNIKDIDAIMSMYNSCVNGMIHMGIDQWDETYPNRNIILEDLKQKTYFVAIKDSLIVGGVNIDALQDDSYLSINWKDKKNAFLSVHRLAVDKKYWDQNIGKNLMLFAEELVKKKKLNSIRLDTYSGNPKAMNFYKQLGYHQLGYIYLKEGKNEYYCFEKIIQ